LYPDALWDKRNLAVRKLGSLGVLIGGCSLVAMIIGIASIAIQVQDHPSPPYMIGLALIAGVLVILFLFYYFNCNMLAVRIIC
jgi:hypothetical protein